MTVTELLDRIIAIYPGADARSIAAMKPVFHARFRHREGPALESAANDTFATFRPTARQTYPNPADFEQHLTSITPPTKGDGGSKLDFAAHRERKNSLMSEWEERQGRGINTARGYKIAAACRALAKSIADQRAWFPDPEPVRLSAEQIQQREDHVVSSERMGTYGAHCIRTENAEAWQVQMDELRPLVKAGRSPSKERKAKIEDAKAHTVGSATKRVAQLAAARRNSEAA